VNYRKAARLRAPLDSIENSSSNVLIKGLAAIGERQ